MRFIYSALLLLPLAGVLSAAAPASKVTPQPAEAAPTTITTLVLRDYQISISTGSSEGNRYDVYSLTGQPVETGLSEAQLQASYPEIYDSLRPAVAADGLQGDLMMMMMMENSEL